MSKIEEKTSGEKRLVEFVPFGTKDKIQLSIEIVKRLIAVKTRSGKNCSDEDAFKFMLMCQARKLNPFEGDAFLIGYDNRDQPDKPSFSLITAHQAFLKRAEVHPEFDGMESGVIVDRAKEIIDLVGDWHMPNDTILGGWAKVYFKNRSKPMHKRLRLARFKKNYGIWLDDPAGMIVKCAEADALRSSFPTMLGGMFIREEMPAVEAEIMRPVFDAADATTNGGAKTEVTVEPPAESGDRMRAAVDKRETKKQTPPPGLQRKKAVEKPAEQVTARQQFADMLAVGKVKPDEFVTLAVKEGWIDADQTWHTIPEERIVEFMKSENWVYIQQALDERATPETAKPAQHSDKLL